MGKASANSIQIFARIRPTRTESGLYNKEEDDAVEFKIPRNLDRDYVNNQKEVYKFRFNHVFDQETKQDEVFERIAKPVVDSVLDGFNGTLFAYGQTGSGKTFTITGGAEKYVDRGVIPRTLQYVFNKLKDKTDYQHQVHIAYMEIYNSKGADLLDPNKEIRSWADLPKVQLFEDEAGNIHLKNLTTHLVTSEEEALNLLFLGDTNRIMAATPSNPESSRSHCIFTIFIQARRVDSDVIRRSKLHVVDLAGSERVSRTGVEAELLEEAKSINSSLFALESVIMALRARAKDPNHFVPYRNALMTSVLRDSLGGNCRTSMIATLSVDHAHIDESISTCRFAMRVAQIKNVVSVNEEVDPSMVIARLKKEVATLKAELRLLKGNENDDDDALTESERLRVHAAVDAWLAGNEELSSDENLTKSWAHIREAQRYSRHCYLQRPGGKGTATSSASSVAAAPAADNNNNQDGMLESMKASIAKLKLQLQQRDNEVNILVKMLKKKKGAGEEEGGGGGGSINLTTASVGGTSSTSVGDTNTTTTSVTSTLDSSIHSVSQQQPRLREQRAHDVRGAVTVSYPDKVGGAPLDLEAVALDATSLWDRSAAFTAFRVVYAKTAVIEDNKAVLRSKYEEAKQLGEVVNGCRARLERYKSQVEQLRLERAMQGLSKGAGANEDEPVDEEEEIIKTKMMEEKNQYKEGFSRLRALKGEIDSLQRLLETERERLTNDFEEWHVAMCAKVQAESEAAPPTAAGNGAPAAVARMGDNDSAAATSQSGGMPPLTGNAEADADILAFYKAREQLLRKSKEF
jgi:kinesin family member 6/9